MSRLKCEATSFLFSLVFFSFSLSAVRQQCNATHTTTHTATCAVIHTTTPNATHITSCMSLASETATALPVPAIWFDLCGTHTATHTDEAWSQMHDSLPSSRCSLQNFKIFKLSPPGANHPKFSVYTQNNRWHIMTQRHFGQFDGYRRLVKMHGSQQRLWVGWQNFGSSQHLCHGAMFGTFVVLQDFSSLDPEWVHCSWLCLCNMRFINNDPETNLSICVNMYIYRYIHWRIYILKIASEPLWLNYYILHRHSIFICLHIYRCIHLHILSSEPFRIHPTWQ